MIKRMVMYLLLGCLLIGPTAAEDSGGSDIEVVVTASRVEEDVAEVPANVTVITSEDLVASGQTTLVEALEGLEGIHFRSFSGNAAQAEVSMRGFGENSHGRVLVLLNGRRLNRPDMASVNWLEIPIENIERIEVVRGGSSVLYGDNAVAGVINIISKQGAKDLKISVSGQYGSFNQNQERVGVSGSIGPLSFSASAEHTASDGYRNRSAYRSIAAGANLGLDLSDILSSTLLLSYDNLFFEMPGYLTKAEMDTDPTQEQPGATADEAHNQYVNADLSLSAGPGDLWLLDSNLSYGMKFMQTDMASWFAFTDLILHTIAATPRLKLEMNLLSGNRLITGVDGYYDLLNLKSYPDTSRGTITQEMQISKKSLGLYARDDLSLLNFLAVSGGLRYELAQIAAKTLQTSGVPVDDAKLHQVLVYDAGVLVQPLPGARLWGKFATVFRYPFVDEQVMYSGFAANDFNSDLEAEKGYNIEAGVEAQLFNLLTLGGNFFLLDMEDEIVFDMFAEANVNQDKTRHMGVEAEAGISIANWLDLFATYTYTNAIYREGTYQDKQIPLVPEHQASAEGLLYLPFGFSLAGSGQYVGASYAGSDFDNNQEMLADYWLLDLFVHYKPNYIPGKLEFFFGMENVLDSRYATMGFDWGALVVYYPGQARSFKLGGSYQY